MSSEPTLVSIINARLEEGSVELPIFDGIATRILKESRENVLNAEQICELIETDPVLVADVLRMANSSFFSGLGSVNSLQEGAVRLGVKQIASIVLSVSQKRMYSASGGMFRHRLLTLWQHASAMAMGARWLALNSGFRDLADEAYVVGLLHDVGKLSLYRIIEELYNSELEPLSDELTMATVNQMYCSHGAKLLGMWNLPESFQLVVEHQADSQFDTSNTMLCIIRLLEKACALEGISDVPDPDIVLEGSVEAEALGMSEFDIAELRLALEDFSQTDIMNSKAA